MKWKTKKVVPICIGHISVECAQFKVDVIIPLNTFQLFGDLISIWMHLDIVNEFGNVLHDVTHLSCPIMAFINV
jgi:hypothetical protein